MKKRILSAPALLLCLFMGECKTGESFQGAKIDLDDLAEGSCRLELMSRNN